jgi:transposase
MKENISDEIRCRRLAFKLFDKGKSTAEILKLIPRSRSWLFKWKKRFEQLRWQALSSFSKSPKRNPNQYEKSAVIMVLRLRKRLQSSEVGLVGPRAIRREIISHRLLNRVPSVSSIKRWLKEAGLTQVELSSTKEPFYPAPILSSQLAFYSCDWIARYIEGGEKLFVFHTIDMLTHALCQTSGTDKTTSSLCHHLLEACSRLGLPDFLQIDNDAAFTGLGKKPRIFGHFVRLALYLGIELIFIPPGEPKRNSVVEGVNHLWARSFWDRNHFASVKAFQPKSWKFLAWYEEYAPPALEGLTVKEACLKVKRRKLTKREIKALPQELPLSEGRIHFIRKVDSQGEINILKENWKVSKRLRGEYVWATINLKEKSLRIYHRRSERAKAKEVKQHYYAIEERVERLKASYRRARRKLRVLKII